MAKRRKKKNRETANTARRRAEQHQAGFERTSLNLPEGVNLFRLKDDKPLRLDILPYRVGKGNPWADEGQLHYERTYFVHRGIGAEQNTYPCLRKTLGKKCPVCEYRAKLSNNPDADEDLIKSLAPSERQIFNVIDTRDRDKGVQIWDMAWWLFGKALDTRIRNGDEEDEYENFYELENGFTLKLGIEEHHFAGRSFYSVESIDFKSRKEDYDEDILEEVYNLDEIIKITPYDELKKILLQTEDDDEDEKETPKSKKKKKQQKEEDEFDEDEEEDNEDLDEEDLDEEDEEEDEDLEDDEEDLDEDFEDEDEDEDKEDEEEDEDLEDEDEDFEDEEESPKPKKKKTTKKKTAKKKSKKKPAKKSSGRKKRR